MQSRKPSQIHEKKCDDEDGGGVEGRKVSQAFLEPTITITERWPTRHRRPRTHFPHSGSLDILVDRALSLLTISHSRFPECITLSSFAVVTLNSNVVAIVSLLPVAQTSGVTIITTLQKLPRNATLSYKITTRQKANLATAIPLDAPFSSFDSLATVIPPDAPSSFDSLCENQNFVANTLSTVNESSTVANYALLQADKKGIFTLPNVDKNWCKNLR